MKKHLPLAPAIAGGEGQGEGVRRAAPLLCPLVMLLTACAAAPEVQRIAVPVPCRVTLPARPLMPTDGLPPDTSLDDFIAAAAAEIERREGYEIQLRAALGACMDGHVGAKNLSPLRGGNEAQQ